MTMSDPLADMLTRIRNGQRAKLATVRSPASNLRLNVLKVLKEEGYIGDFEVEEVGKGKSDVSIALRYYEGSAVIQSIKKISKPGRRVYADVDNLPRVRSGLGMAILSTSKGVMSDYQARIEHVGGEILCEVA